ncbi:MAG: hypothetical protein KID02_10010 [Clostridiales bacterium]|nr:hypothetical protein [Clostridiales bacterium]
MARLKFITLKESLELYPIESNNQQCKESKEKKESNKMIDLKDLVNSIDDLRGTIGEVVSELMEINNKTSKKQIKLFYGGAQEALERDVNEFCEKVNVIDIKFAECFDAGDSYTTIMVIYEKE